jgi:hypothetical protein
MTTAQPGRPGKKNETDTAKRRSTSVGEKDPHNAYPTDANVGTPPMPADSDEPSGEDSEDTGSDPRSR